MKLSRKFLSDYLNIPSDVTTKQLAEEMTHIGNEYDSCEKLIPATNLIIGEVLECVDHPDSDHLHLCKVNIGSEVLDIVCGAPNARKGIKVILIAGPSSSGKTTFGLSLMKIFNFIEKFTFI